VHSFLVSQADMSQLVYELSQIQKIATTLANVTDASDGVLSNFRPARKHPAAHAPVIRTGCGCRVIIIAQPGYRLQSP